MEVVTIEGRTFSYVCERFMEFAKRIESLCSTHTQKVENWLDSQEVCLLLGFSKRTLQYYRSSGRLAYSHRAGAGRVRSGPYPGRKTTAAG